MKKQAEFFDNQGKPLTEKESKDIMYQSSGVYNSEEHFIQIQKFKIVLIILLAIVACLSSCGTHVYTESYYVVNSVEKDSKFFGCNYYVLAKNISSGFWIYCSCDSYAIGDTIKFN